jgi:hydroxypyruvate isomerase
MRVTRRNAIKTMTVGALTAALPGRVAMAETTARKGNIRHSVCKWCYGKIPLEDFCQAVRAMGLESVDLLGPGDWPTLKKHGLTCAMASAPNAGDGLGGITRAFNRVEHHDRLVPVYEQLIAQAADAGVPNVICFSGNRDGLDDQQGLVNCAAGVKRILPAAEKHGITVAMELLNSKVDHKDYQCDHTAWGVELCRRVGSERFKLLYDIYHMQIMEGDVVATIRHGKDCIAHYHTGGVPGRAEIDGTQELNYAFIMKAIVETGFKGFVAQEFVPKRDPLASLQAAVDLCDV